MPKDHPPGCPCGKGKPFDSCCGPLLNGMATAKTPEQLMRSRYTAYALGGQGRYLLDTWFPATAKGLTEVDLSQRTKQWRRLEVLNKSQMGDSASVEFNAFYLDNNNEEKKMHEISEFSRIRGRWFYVGGLVS